MTKRVLFIFNPLSGKGTIKNKLFEIVNFITANGGDATVHPTQGKLDASKTISEKAMGYDLVILCGGDGTLNEGVRGMLSLPKDKRPLLGYLPMGSTNDFALSLGLPTNAMKAMGIIFKGKEFKCDIGRFCNDCFVYVAAFGAFTDVAYDTPQQAKNMLGHMAYILEGIKRLPTLRSYSMKVVYDTITIEDDFIFGMVSNSFSIGGVQRYKEDRVCLDDGLFECMLVKNPENPIEIQSIVAGLLAQDFSAKEFYFFKAEKISVQCDEDVSWTLDGEFGGEHKAVEIENMHKELGIMVKK